jgi:CheY-like chemotaxis protein
METPQPIADLAPGARRRILVVDDDSSLRLLLRETLAADEFELEEVASAEEAQEVARFWRPAVVLLDVTLPGLDGLSFCRELTRGGEADEPSVILLTGTVMTDREARDAGARAMLRKPFSPLELIGLIDRLKESSNDLLVERSEGAPQRAGSWAPGALARISGSRPCPPTAAAWKGGEAARPRQKSGPSGPLFACTLVRCPDESTARNS